MFPRADVRMTMMRSLSSVPEASSQSYGGETQANMQIWGPIIKGLLIQTTHLGYVYNIIPTESFPNSLYFNSDAHAFLRKNKQATKKRTAKDERKTKNRSKEKQKQEIHSPCTEEGAVTPNPDLRVLALVKPHFYKPARCAVNKGRKEKLFQTRF